MASAFRRKDAAVAQIRTLHTSFRLKPEATPAPPSAVPDYNAASMSFEAGTRLGPYEIIAPIGAGGMGEVYRARDTRLDRTVAVKVLPGALAADSESRQRFEQEARVIAALNDPHICTIHDVGRHGELDYLVLEFLEGEDPRSPAPSSSGAAGGRRARHRHPDRHGSRPGTPRRHRAPRFEAGQRHARPPGGCVGPGARQAARLRRRVADRSGAANGRRGDDRDHLVDDVGDRAPCAVGVWRRDGHDSGTWRRSSSTATPATSVPTSSRSDACSTSCSPAAKPSTGSTS